MPATTATLRAPLSLRQAAAVAGALPATTACKEPHLLSPAAQATTMPVKASAAMIARIAQRSITASTTEPQLLFFARMAGTVTPTARPADLLVPIARRATCALEEPKQPVGQAFIRTNMARRSARSALQATSVRDRPAMEPPERIHLTTTWRSAARCTTAQRRRQTLLTARPATTPQARWPP